MTVVAAVAAASCLGPTLELPSPQSSGDGANLAAPRPGARPAHALPVTRAAELLDGMPSDGRIGDFRLENERIAVIVSAAGHPVGFAASGGNIIDAAPIGARDSLQQVYGYLGDAFPRQPIYTHVAAREAGGTAYVVARGHDSDAPAVAVETAYALAPGANAVAITTTLTNGGTTPLSRFAVGDAVEWGRAQRFAPGKGFYGSGRFTVDAGWEAGLGDEAAYAYVVGEGPLEARHGWAWTDFNAAVVDLPPGASVKLTRWLVVGATSDAGLYETIADLRKQRWARLSGRILEEATAETLAGATLFFDDHDGPYAVTRSTIHGYDIYLPAGDYRVRAEGIGRSGPGQLEVTVGNTGGATHDVIMSKRGTLAYAVRDADGPLPAKLTLLGLPPTRDPRLGPPFASPGGDIVVTATGTGELPLPPGSYRVVASRGPEYTIDEQRVDVPPGGTARATFNLRRAVDAFGWRCVDPHQHAFPSSDSAVSLEDRAATDLAEGLDVVVATDHDSIALDWKDAVAALHAARPLSVIVGDEVSLERFGHFSVIPWTPQPSAPRGGAPDVRHKPAPEAVRALAAPGRVVILNHPRGEGRPGAFDVATLDDPAKLPKEIAGGFDAIEIFSGKDPSRVEPALRDWMALLDRGLTYTAVGGSDSHLVFGQEVGYPRTCFPVEGALDADALVAAVKKRREALVTNGPFVKVSVGGRGMGQLAPAPRGRARLDVEVQAAPWIDVRRLELFINGSRRGKPIDIPASTKPVRYKGGIDLRVERDAYVVVVVRGDAPLGVVVPPDEGQSPPTPLAITNPIYLDRDGDGRYMAPSVPVKPPAK